jgi:putative ABC transport system permease protein
MSFFRRIINLGRSERLSADIDRELSFHFREHVDELMDQGMSETDAILAARRRFGSAMSVGERTRDQDIVGWLDSLMADMRYGFRTLRRSLVFTTVAIASLALGIGANTAIYSLMDAVVLRSLPVPAPDELVQVKSGDESGSEYFTNPLWEQVRDRQTGFQSIAAFSETSFNIADGGEARNIMGMWASGEFFSLFGMRPALGRLFSKADDQRGCSGIGVLGHGFWLSEYGGQRDVIGKSISIAGKPFQIIGVVAPGFVSPEVGRDVHLYVPVCSEAYLRGARSSLDRRSNWWLRVIGRRNADLTLPQVIARLKSIAPEVYAQTVPQNWAAQNKIDYEKRTLSATSAASGMSSVRTRYAKALYVLMGAVALVLLIACANVANLLLARSEARQRELAIRMAVGAARRRLVRQLMTESAMLAMFGAAGGLALAHWGTFALVGLISTPNNPVSLDLSINLQVLGFTALVATATIMLFGLAPAWRATRVSPQTAMKANARGVAEGGGYGRLTLGKALVAAQVALSLTLLVGAGLFIGSLRNLRELDPGFRAEGVLLVSAGFGRTGIPQEQLRTTYQDLLQRLRAVPGVRSAGSSDLTPLGRSSWNDRVYADGFAPASEREGVIWFNEVSDRYFATLETRILAGRDFDATDVPAGVKTAIINDQAAKTIYGSVSPLGKQFRTKSGDTYSDPYTIVGVVGTAKYQNLREQESPTIYLPASQNAVASPAINFALRSDSDPKLLIPAVKEVFRTTHPLTGVQFETFSNQLAVSLNRERVLALLSGAFGAIALALSMLGLYGVMAYTVARRRNEIGVRIALGADRTRVLRMVLADVGRVVIIGLVIGAAGAYASGKLLTGFLFGLAPADPRVLSAAALLLAAVAVAAGLIPALRAARVDPVAALRED